MAVAYREAKVASGTIKVQGQAGHNCEIQSSIRGVGASAHWVQWAQWAYGVEPSNQWSNQPTNLPTNQPTNSP